MSEKYLPHRGILYEKAKEGTHCPTSAQLLQDIEGKQQQLKYKQLCQGKANASKDWETCDRMQKEMVTLRKQVFEAQKELKLFQRQEVQVVHNKVKSKQQCHSFESRLS